MPIPTCIGPEFPVNNLTFPNQVASSITASGRKPLFGRFGGGGSGPSIRAQISNADGGLVLSRDDNCKLRGDSIRFGTYAQSLTRAQQP